MTRVLNERVWEVKKYIKEDTTNKYSLVGLLKSYGVFDGAEEIGNDEYLCKCPLHEDWSPSASFNDAKGIWHCFSCGRGGDYINLYSRLSGGDSGYYASVQRLLRENNRMRLDLGFESIFTYSEEDEDWNRHSEIKRVSLRGKHTEPTYLLIAKKQKKQGVSLEQAKRTILSMQAGFEIETFLGMSINDISGNIQEDVLDLDDL